jgi:hypothetical protein
MYSFTNQFMSNDKTVEFLKATMMGPNAMRLAEELASHLILFFDRHNYAISS